MKCNPCAANASKYADSTRRGSSTGWASQTTYASTSATASNATARPMVTSMATSTTTTTAAVAMDSRLRTGAEGTLAVSEGWLRRIQAVYFTVQSQSGESYNANCTVRSQ